MKKEFFKILNLSKTDRMRVKLDIYRGKLADIVLQYESWIEEKWIPIIRYDMAHGFFHRDEMNYKGEEVTKTTLDFADLETAANFAEQDIKDKWEFYKERFLKSQKRK